MVPGDSVQIRYTFSPNGGLCDGNLAWYLGEPDEEVLLLDAGQCHTSEVWITEPGHLLAVPSNAYVMVHFEFTILEFDPGTMIGDVDPYGSLLTDKVVSGLSVNLLNPVMDDLPVIISSVKSQAVELTLFSANGQIVKQSTHRIAAGQSKLVLPLPALGPGHYYLQYSAKSDRGTIPVVKL
ncbi:MAG: T9SS type A sorting domain-containing protein [Flavobacteriales bacterium]|nr:T9SS type A sorting domain-containing protein [Flavobacteriales bacterium]